MKRIIGLIICVCLSLASTAAFSKPGKKPPHGLNPQAAQELQDAGVDKYLGQFTPVDSTDVGDGWTQHLFDTDDGDGPICVAGTPFSVFTKAQNPAKVLIMLQGGGACWQDFYRCNILAEDQEPPVPQEPEFGIWDFGNKLNPVGNWSVVYMPYCDGSVFSGDKDVVDASFPFGPVRFHRGLRNLTAGIDVAKAMFPNANRILVAGSSAGGVGAAGFAPFLARMAFGNNKKLMVFNDAGPVAVNLADTGAIAARAADWDFGQFYPSSCTACSDMGQGTEIIKWRLQNDSTIREAFYSTDFDVTNRGFLNLLPSVTPDDPAFDLQFLLTGLAYRELIITEHGAIHNLFPDRYKRFIEAFKFSHTALQFPILYGDDGFGNDRTVNGIALFEWLDDFLVPRPFWVDAVEELTLP